MKNDNYVVVAGTFDLFHDGHKNILERASKFGKVIAFVNTDKFVEEFKGITPTINQQNRLKTIHNLEYVDRCFLNYHSDLTITLEPYVQIISGVVFGDDYTIEKYREQTQITKEWQIDHEIALIQFPRTPGVSSSQIRKTLL